MNNNTELDSFDRALLTELRLVAAEGAGAPVRRTRRRWAYAGSGVAAAAVTAFGLSTLGSPGAYAVDEQGDGDIVITIHELDDADGLEQALADHGIEADVNYQADGTTMGIGPDGDLADPPPVPPDDHPGEGGTITEGEAGTGPSTQVGPGGGKLPEDLPCGGLDDMPFTTELTSDSFVITIPADSILRDSDAVVRIMTSGEVKDQVAGLAVAYSIGDADCGFGMATATVPETKG